MCSLRLKTHLDNKTVQTLQYASIFSDNYTLSHKKKYQFYTKSGNYKNQSTERTNGKPVVLLHKNSQSSYSMSNPKSDSFEKKSLTCC